MTYIHLYALDTATRPLLKYKLEENPEWALILGLGYNPSQRRTLIYKHLGKLLEQMRSRFYNSCCRLSIPDSLFPRC